MASLSDKYTDEIAEGAGDIQVSDALELERVPVRATLNQGIVRAYAAQMPLLPGESHHFPPVRIWQITGPPAVAGELWLSSGRHRLKAAEWQRLDSLPALFFSGPMEDAIADAVRSNARHGHRPTRDDITATIRLLLTLPEWREKSDRAFALLIGCSPTTIAKYRPMPSDVETRVGRDGKRYPAHQPEPPDDEAGAEVSSVDTCDDDEPDTSWISTPDESPVDEGKSIKVNHVPKEGAPTTKSVSVKYEAAPKSAPKTIAVKYDAATDQDADTPTRRRFTLPDNPTEAELLTVESWLESQDERPAIERFQVLWSGCDEQEKSEIAWFVSEG